MATTRTITADELLTMPDDGRRYELYRGELREVSPSGFEASYIGALFVAEIGAFARRHGLGAVTMADGGYLFEVGPDTVRAPDVAFIRADRLPPPDQRAGYPNAVPDLVIEVVSPNDTRHEVADKVAFYLERGVPLVWTVWPRPREVVAHRPGEGPQTFREGDVLTAEDVLPGFRLPVEDVFR
jgi:Uma2 family endonuclease